MGANVVASVEMPMDFAARTGLSIRMFGQLTVWRDGVEQALPASRKVRALLAYLALAPADVGRSELCDLLWDVPNDPRGELRWCLSKIRTLVDEPTRKRVRGQRNMVGLDLYGLSLIHI